MEERIVAVELNKRNVGLVIAGTGTVMTAVGLRMFWENTKYRRFYRYAAKRLFK